MAVRVHAFTSQLGYARHKQSYHPDKLDTRFEFSAGSGTVAGYHRGGLLATAAETHWAVRLLTEEAIRRKLVSRAVQFQLRRVGIAKWSPNSASPKDEDELK